MRRAAESPNAGPLPFAKNLSSVCERGFNSRVKSRLLLLTLIQRDVSWPGFYLLAQTSRLIRQLGPRFATCCLRWRSHHRHATDTSGGGRRIFEAGLFVFFSQQSSISPHQSRFPRLLLPLLLLLAHFICSASVYLNRTIFPLLKTAL